MSPFLTRNKHFLVIVLIGCIQTLLLTVSVDAVFSPDSVEGVPHCSVNQAIQWGACLAALNETVQAAVNSTQADWEEQTLENKTLIEAGYYCNAAKNLLIAAAKCIQPCTNDKAEYFGRDQLLEYCETQMDGALLGEFEFARFANFGDAQEEYTCSTPLLTCEGIITTELTNTLNSQGGGSFAMRASSSLVIALVVLVLASLA